MRRSRLAFIALALFTLAGCASAPPPPTYYLLRGDSDEGQGPIDARIRAGLGRVVVAPYLLRTRGVMIETEPGVVRAASHHQWAEPVDEGLRWFVRSQITRELGDEIGGGLSDIQDWDYIIDLFVSRMHATMGGSALLEAIFVVRATDPNEENSEYRFSQSAPLPEEGYAGVVAAERSLARALAGAIASVLQERLDAAGANASAPETELGEGG